MMLSSWVQGRVKTNYKKGYYILLQNDNWYFNWSQWIIAMPPREVSGMPVLRLRWSFLRYFPNTNHSSAHIISAEKVLLSMGTPASHHRILCKFPCGRSVASNCTQEYGWMEGGGFITAGLDGALHQTSTFRWYQLVHFNYPLILSLWRGFMLSLAVMGCHKRE